MYALETCIKVVYAPGYLRIICCHTAIRIFQSNTMGYIAIDHSWFGSVIIRKESRRTFKAVMDHMQDFYDTGRIDFPTWVASCKNAIEFFEGDNAIEFLQSNNEMNFLQMAEGFVDL